MKYYNSDAIGWDTKKIDLGEEICKLMGSVFSKHNHVFMRKERSGMEKN